MLRGWIEIGMSNPNMFVNQSNPDVIFRTWGQSNDNQIIIGNTASNDPAGPRSGAIYVKNNNVGLKKVPLSNIDLDVNGIISTIDERVASNLVVGYGTLPGTLQLRGDMTVIGNGVSNMVVSNSNNAFSFKYGNTERVKITNDGGMFMNDSVYVRNDMYATGFFMDADSTCNVRVATFEQIRTAGGVFSDSRSNDIVIRATSNSQRLLFGFGSNVNSTMVLTKSNLSIEKGAMIASNVSIGTTTPAADFQLYVGGSTRIEGDLVVNGAYTLMNTDVKVTEQFTVSNNGTGPALSVIQYGTQPIAEFKDDNITVLKIFDGGFVTIGSNTAATKLDVEGSATIRGNIHTSNIYSSNIQTSNFTTMIATINSNAYIYNGDLRIYGSNNFTGLTDQARVYLGNDNIFLAGTKAGLVLQVPNTTYPLIVENNTGFMGLGVMDPEENLHVQSNVKVNGSTFLLGNVGVGNSNPGKKVDITGTTRISETVTLLNDISIMSNNGAWSTQTGRQLYLRYSTNGGQDAGYIQSIDRSNSTFYNLAVEAKNIAIGGTGALSNPILYAQQGGRVGLGTTNPLFALHATSNINDGVVIAVENTNNSTSGWAGFAARNSASSVNGGMRMGILNGPWGNGGIYYQNAGFIESDHSNGMSIASTSNTGEIRFYTGGTTERARITSNGLVGLGTSVPTERLQVVGKAFVDTQVLGTSNDNALVPSFAFKEDSNTGIFHPSNQAIGFTTNGSEKMRIDSQGFVGIGLNDAAYSLDVVGNIHTSNNSAFLAGNRSGFLRMLGSLSNTYIQSGLSNATNSAAPLIFSTINNGTEWARFNSNGFLGLGVNAPMYRLDVSGQANITNTTSNTASLLLSNAWSPYLEIKGSNTSFIAGASGSNTHHSTDAVLGDVVIKNSQLLSSGKMLLQVGSGVSAITINSNNTVGINTTSPIAIFHVNGDILANSNIKSSVGTLGPCFSLIPESAYADVSVGAQLMLDNTLEAGNPASTTTRPLFYGSSYLFQDASGENMRWNYARLLFRGCPLSATASVSTFTVQSFVQSRTPQYSNVSTAFNLSNDGYTNGYVSYATPWFTMSESNARNIALSYSANTTSSVFRVGQVLIQFKT